MTDRLYQFFWNKFRSGAAQLQPILKGLILKGLSGLLLSLAIGCLGFLCTPMASADNYTKEFLVNVDFSERDLTDSTFTKANLREANLSHTNLQGVSFFGANLESVDLEGADLRNATLDSARFVKANLTHANLEGAFAFNAQFNGATIEGADFTDVLLRQDMQEILCDAATGVNPTTGRATRDTLECD